MLKMAEKKQQQKTQHYFQPFVPALVLWSDLFHRRVTVGRVQKEILNDEVWPD